MVIHSVSFLNFGFLYHVALPWDNIVELTEGLFAVKFPGLSTLVLSIEYELILLDGAGIPILIFT